MAKASKHELYVVDGSNIATEGRSVPSLEQLNDAVLAFMEDHPDSTVTVVVDATFGHRIDKKEVKSFDEAVANNDITYAIEESDDLGVGDPWSPVTPDVNDSATISYTLPTGPLMAWLWNEAVKEWQ